LTLLGAHRIMAFGAGRGRFFEQLLADCWRRWRTKGS
jgi:hypothetical protein